MELGRYNTVELRELRKSIVTEYAARIKSIRGYGRPSDEAIALMDEMVSLTKQIDKEFQSRPYELLVNNLSVY